VRLWVRLWLSCERTGSLSESRVGELIARVRGDCKLTSHERRLAQRLENYFEMYPEQMREIIKGGASS
jgi:hypothetical protein